MVLLWLPKDRDTGAMTLALLAKEVAKRISTLWAFMFTRLAEVLEKNPVLTVTP